MPMLELTVDQVASLVRELPPVAKRQVLMTLASDGRQAREARIDRNELRLRHLSAQRGLDWDTLTEDEREAFVDALLHEDS